MNHVHIKALERAAELHGGIPELAMRLGMPATTLILMMDGTIGVPDELFIRVVDIVISADLSSVTAPMVLVVEDDPATAAGPLPQQSLRRHRYTVEVTDRLNVVPRDHSHPNLGENHPEPRAGTTQVLSFFIPYCPI